MSFRKVVFWLHLAAGVVAGVIVLILSLTGAAIAFEKELVARSELEARTLPPPTPGAPRLSVEEGLDLIRAEYPGAGPSTVTLFSDPQLAVAMSFGRTNVCYLNPFTGEIRNPGTTDTRAFMRFMTDWHRWLGREGEGRAVGKAMTGASNAAFLFLTLSGLCLWWPRRWSWSALKASGWFNGQLRGKARDWNWHNVLGIWSAPVLLVLTLSGLVISYRWASDLVYTVTGTTPTPPSPPGAMKISRPEPGARPLDYDKLVSIVQEEVPDWEQISLRFSTPNVRAGATPAGGGERERPHADRPKSPEPRAVSISVRQRDGWPRFASLQLSLDPFTGSILKRESYAEDNTGRQVRTWLRFLHTGEAFGIVGKLVAALASIGGALLVYTGFALAIRRLAASRRPAATTEGPSS